MRPALALLACVACREPPPPPAPPPVSPCNAPEPAHTGEATHYNADGTGQCSFDAPPTSVAKVSSASTPDATSVAKVVSASTPGAPTSATGTVSEVALSPRVTREPLLVAAINDADYARAARCGSCVVVVGPDDAEILVRIVDRCPACKPGGLDLSRDAFALLAPLDAGRIPIRWMPVPCEVDGPLVYHFKPGSNADWTAIQIRNHRYPITALDARDDLGMFTALPRTAYNYFVGKRLGDGPYTLRVTDARGQTHVETGVVGPDHTGTAQLPSCP